MCGLADQLSCFSQHGPLLIFRWPRMPYLPNVCKDHEGIGMVLVWLGDDCLCCDERKSVILNPISMR